MITARSIRVRGVVQGVGFRPFVFRAAQANGLSGWVANTEEGVQILLEGPDASLEIFLRELEAEHPSAACITSIDVQTAQLTGCEGFSIVESSRNDRITARISPDLAICDACLRELFDPHDRRYRYPYINCTHCGPRYSILRRLPYDRPNTTMQAWPMDDFCDGEYHDVANRRFHAQPVACPACGPSYSLESSGECIQDSEAGIARAAKLLRSGKIVAVKGLGGYHLACDASNPAAVRLMRERKYRKEKPFALMAKDLHHAHRLIELNADAESLLLSAARPIVLAPAKIKLPDVAAGTSELGVMLPYTPLHHLLFAAGAPDVLVMTSGNRSSEPIAYDDEDAQRTLAGIADAFLIGKRPIARRVDDSVVRAGSFGPTILRRARGLAPAAVSALPSERPILAVGADLKNTVTLVVDGQAFVSQHIGDLHYYDCLLSFEQTIHDLLSMYEIGLEDLLVVHDAHPQYASTAAVRELVPNAKAVQHHRAHIASVLAEHGAFERRVLGISFDGAGYGDDGAIWGGEIFSGSVTGGFSRVAHLRNVWLPGGDASAQYPVQAAAGFLSQMDSLPDLLSGPFHFPPIYTRAMAMVARRVRTFASSSMGRLFDAAAALLGFTGENTYEGQAAAWLEHQARGSSAAETAYPFPLQDNELDFRPLFRSLIDDRLRGRDPREIARAFQLSIARGVAEAAKQLCANRGLDTIVLSGGVFQNELLLEDLKRLLQSEPLQIWTNHAVPPNDGGISLGQAALAAFQQFDGVAQRAPAAAQDDDFPDEDAISLLARSFRSGPQSPDGDWLSPLQPWMESDRLASPDDHRRKARR